MNGLPGAISPWKWRLFRLIGGSALLAVLWVSLPFLFDLASRGTEWILGLLPGFESSWEALLWFR
jgi:hypothetical protein